MLVLPHLKGLTAGALASKTFKSASLDLNFASTKSLVDSVSGNNLITFSRASSGTYVDSQGVIRTATTNLLLRSEEFDDAYWTKNNLQAFGSGSIANAIAAPNGTITADKIVENTVNAQHMVFRGITPEGGLRYTLSFYAKAAERSFVIGAFSGGGLASDCTVGINLTNGSVVSTSNIPDIATATLVGDGWYRVVLSKTLPSSTSVQPRIIISTNGTTQVYTGDGTSGLFIWGAQLEASSAVGEYIPTTSTINSAPRFDHNPTTGESLGLLVEEQRTNLLYASAFSSIGVSATNNAWYETFAELDTTVNAAIAPDGTTTAALLSVNTSTAFRCVFQRTNNATGGTYAFSCYLKANSTDTQARLLLTGDTGATNTVRADFTLSSAGVVGSASVTGTAISAGSPTIQAMPNGWYRCTILATLASPTNITALVYPGAVGAQTTNSQTLVWGAQLEAGAFPTSYIPTTTATATRSADVASITGSNFSSWYRQDEGTVFVNSSVSAAAITPSVALYNYAIHDGSTNNRIAVYKRANADTSTRLDVTAATVSSSFINAGIFGQANLIASAIRLNDFAISLNGAAAVIDTTGNVPLVNQMNIGSYVGATNSLNGTLKRLTYWPQRLSNPTLQAITQ